MERSLEIKNELSELAALNTFIGSAARAVLMQESETRRLRLAVEEAVTNVILYAYPGRTGQPISIRFEAEAQRVKVVICDSGIPFDPTRLVPPDLKLPLESRPIGGLGTFLLKELMSEVQYRREGDRNILTLIKTIN